MANYSFPANGQATMQNPSIEFQETNAKDFSNQFFFHSKHIQSGKNGRWKDELSDNEINFLTNRYKEFIELFKLET